MFSIQHKYLLNCMIIAVNKGLAFLSSSRKCQSDCILAFISSDDLKDNDTASCDENNIKAHASQSVCSGEILSLRVLSH